jgi:DNA-binding IclR family transcriptional regulator
MAGNKAQPGEGDRKFVVALARGLDVLRAFRAGDSLLGNGDIAVRTGLPKPTVSRLTYTLTRLGYLVAVPRLGKYQLAPAALALGYTALAAQGIRPLAQPFMQEMADYAGGAVAVGARDRLSMVYLAQARGNSALQVRLDVGSRIPIGGTAMGRAWLAAIGPELRGEILERLAERAGERWPKLHRGIEEALESHARRGFVLSVGEWQDDVHAVGVPLVPRDGSPPLAFNCGAPFFRYSREALEQEIGPRLVDMVRRIEGVLDGTLPGSGQSHFRKEGAHDGSGARAG